MAQKPKSAKAGKAKPSAAKSPDTKSVSAKAQAEEKTLAAEAMMAAEEQMAGTEPDEAALREPGETPEPGPEPGLDGTPEPPGGGRNAHAHMPHLPAFGDESAVDLAIGALCQSYSHALSLAFHDAVAERQRRTALIDAAVARAVEEIAATKPKEFEDRMKELKAGLDVLNAPNGADMAAYAGITREFQQAAESLMKLRDGLKD